MNNFKQFTMFDHLESIASDSTRPYPEFLDTRKQNSIEAAKLIEPHKSRLHKIILSALANIGGQGTKDEIAAFTCLKSEQIHKRMSELEKLNMVEPNGKKLGDSGRSITVWRLK